MIRFDVATAVAVAVVVTAGLGTGMPTRGAGAREHTVVIEGMQFKPAALTARRGDRVVWRNKDLVPHTATAARVFDSRTIEAGGSWTYTAGKAGTLAYVCTFHPGMKGSLTVE
jgi:plastocyanin